MITMKFLTMNIAFASDPVWDGINNFRHRLGVLMDHILTEKPDVFCMQEVRQYQYDLLKPFLKGAGYSFIYNQRETDMSGEGLMVCLRDETTEFQTMERYWFSDTPQIPGTRFPNQTEYTRIGQEALVRYLPTGEFFRVYNNHFECRNPEACTKSMQLLLSRLQKKQSVYPCRFFLAGDLNSLPESDAIQTACHFDVFPVIDVTKELPGTAFSFHDPGVAHGKVDYIFTDRTSADEVREVRLLDDHANGIWLSDHYPVCAEFDF